VFTIPSKPPYSGSLCEFAIDTFSDNSGPLRSTVRNRRLSSRDHPVAASSGSSCDTIANMKVLIVTTAPKLRLSNAFEPALVTDSAGGLTGSLIAALSKHFESGANCLFS